MPIVRYIAKVIWISYPLNEQLICYKRLFKEFHDFLLHILLRLRRKLFNSIASFVFLNFASFSSLFGWCLSLTLPYHSIFSFISPTLLMITPTLCTCATSSSRVPYVSSSSSNFCLLYQLRLFHSFGVHPSNWGGNYVWRLFDWDICS